MGKDVFNNLDKNYKYLSNYMNIAKWALFNRPHTAIVRQKNYIDNLILEIAKLEDIFTKEFVKMSQSSRVAKLKDNGILTDEVFKCFNEVRRMGSKAYDGDMEAELVDAFIIYKNVYEITAWFVIKYIDEDYEGEAYVSPMPVEGKTYSVDNEMILAAIKKAENENGSSEEESQEEGSGDNSIDDDMMNLALESIFEDF